MNIVCCLHDQVLGARLAELLARHGFDYEMLRHESALLRVLRHRGGVDLALVDIGHDPAVEESVLSWLTCRTGETVPVLLMSSHWSPQRIATALEAGADDCLSKPIDGLELVARIKAVLRRSGAVRPGGCTRLELAGFVLDRNVGTLVDRGRCVALTPREFALAWLLFSNPGVKLARESISLAIWGTDKEVADRTIEQHVYKLRKKIGLGHARGVTIRTTYGQGYRLELGDTRPPRAAAAGASRLTRLDAERNAVAAPSIETAGTATPPVRAVRA